MEAFDFDDNVIQAEKPSPTPRFRGLREIKKLFRIMEIFLVLLSLTWASNRLPFVVRISCAYFRQLINVVVSHLFIFLLSNVIVLILLFKSRHLFPQQDFQNISETHLDFSQEFIKNSDGRAHLTRESSSQPEEIVYQDKQTILEVTTVKVHKRSQSENLRREKSMEKDHKCGSCGKQLRRSETERRRIVEEVAAENVEMVDELSNEEFQRAIEAFIAKQIKFHQEEKLAIVLHGCT
ncbi:hypothetical protein Pfo_007643 [Paulownia fortunei]|nr:hypothetical protein Pfo_007643 [Paulownia fortunei]